MTHRPTPNPPDVPRPASTELLALAAKARPDWAPHALIDALAQARTHSMTWGHVLVAVAQLMADPAGQPGDLVSAASEPWLRPRPALHPDIAHRRADEIRAALRHPNTTHD
ncbi:hypothetical protein [Streptomyces sp. CAU 1734]|uniref:hypothetical protein n=1 Tax=Streptomyces sp. CAU 1734 TaxID=3140360 RepID=UPI0032604C06